jgi:hypothetical protein
MFYDREAGLAAGKLLLSFTRIEDELGRKSPYSPDGGLGPKLDSQGYSVQGGHRDSD